MKKLFSFIFVLAMAFVLFACGKTYKIEISEDQANVIVEKGESVTITPSFTDGETLSWKSSNESVVTVDGGKLTAVGEGEATITVAISGKEDKASAEVKVTVKPISVKGITLEGKTACFIGEEFDLTLTVTPADAKDKSVTWASSDNAIATVTNGKVKALAVGEVTISATANDGSGIKGELKIAVAKINVNTVSISGLSEMNVGDTQTVAATIDPANATNPGIEFSSSDTSILTVNAAGLVTAVSAGTAKIIATAKDDATKKAELTITVKQLVEEITIDGDDEMNVNDTQKVDVYVDPEEASNKEYELSSSDETILTVDAEGNVKALAAGKAKVIATAKDGSGVTAELEITVTLVNLVSLELAGKAAVVVGEEQTLGVSYYPESASYKEVTFVSSDPEVVSISEEGVAKGLKAGSAIITVTSVADETKKASLSIEVFEATTALAIKGATTMFIGKEQNLVVTTTPAAAMQKFDFASSDDTVVKVYADGKVESLKTGTAKITVSAKDGSGITAEIEISVCLEVTYVKQDATADITRGEETLKLNENLFTTVEAAIAAVGVGGKVVLYPGTYAEKITIEKGVTITSDLAKLNPAEDDTDFKDATKAAIVTAKVLALVDDITIEGLTFTGNARIVKFGPNGANSSNFTFKNNYVHDTYAATLDWKDTSYGAGASSEDGTANYPGFISLCSLYGWMRNTQILNNKFENVSDTNVYIDCTNSVTVIGNVFTGGNREALRFEYANNYGTFTFEDNIISDFDYAGIFIRSYGSKNAGPIEVNVLRNYFKNCGKAKETGTRGVAAFATSGYQETADAAFVFKYNIFEGNNDNIAIRANVTDVSKWTPTNYTLDVSYNAFVLADANAMINRSFFGSDSASTNYAIGTFDKNFYGTDLLTKVAVADANYQNIVKKDSTTYNNIYALEKALPSEASLPAYTATPALKTVAEAYELALNTAVALKGQVSYVYSGGFWLADETGAIYVFGHAEEVKLGDQVEVEGNLYNYKDTKRLNFAKTVKVTASGTYEAAPVAKTEDEFKVMTQAGEEITLAGVIVKSISNGYVYCKIGATEFTINTNGIDEAQAFAGYIDAEKGITVNVLTYFKDGSKAMSVMAHPENIVSAELAPTQYVVNPNAVAANNVVNKFSDLTLADNMKVLFASGTYEEAITIDKNGVTLGSTNADNPANIVTTLTVADAVTGLTIQDLLFNGNANIIGTAANDVTIQRCTFDNVTTTDDATVHFNGNVSNFVFDGNTCVFKSNRGVRFEKEVHSLTVTNNSFEGVSGKLYDMVRGMNLVDGEVLIAYNTFDTTTQSHIMLRCIGSGNYNVLYNTFKNAACVSLDMRETKEQDLQGKAVINVMFNTFDGGENDWGTIRLRNSHATDLVTNTSEPLNDPTQVEVNINYNKFVNIVFDADTTYYVDKPTGNCAEGLFNIDKNYSDLGEPQAAWFSGMAKSFDNWYTSQADFDYEAFPPVFSFTDTFNSYAAGWSTSYGEKALTNADLGSTSYIDLSIVLSRAARQTSTVTDAPILGANASSAANATVYATFTGDLSDMKFAKVVTKRWSGTAEGRYADIHLEYTTDGTNWTSCSNVATAAGTLLSTEMTGAIAFRLSFTTAYKGNVQLALLSVEFSKTEFPTE